MANVGFGSAKRRRNPFFENGARSERLVQQQYGFKGVEGVKPPLGGGRQTPPQT
jgi:hypothetical protein